MITDYDPAVGVTFAKNDNYWDKDNVAIEDAQVRVIKDAAAALSAYQAGELSRLNLILQTYQHTRMIRNSPGDRLPYKLCTVQPYR